MSARLIKSHDAGALPLAPFALRGASAEAATGEPSAPVLWQPRPAFAPAPATPLAPEAAPGDAALADRHLASFSASSTAIGSADAADTLLAAARDEAERIVADARAAAEQIEGQARERGLAEARRMIDAEVSAAIEPLRASLAATIARLDALRPEINLRAERDLVRLALEIARKIVGREVAADQEIVLTLARVALARLDSGAHASVARVHLNPDDCLYVEARRDELKAGRAVELIADPAVGRGGCLVHTDAGEIDARIEQQFAEIERGFLA